jgi:hypothetical protein
MCQAIVDVPSTQDTRGNLDLAEAPGAGSYMHEVKFVQWSGKITMDVTSSGRIKDLGSGQVKQTNSCSRSILNWSTFGIWAWETLAVS